MLTIDELIGNLQSLRDNYGGDVPVEGEVINPDEDAFEDGDSLAIESVNIAVLGGARVVLGIGLPEVEV